jgi:hypothetical protein
MAPSNPPIFRLSVHAGNANIPLHYRIAGIVHLDSYWHIESLDLPPRCHGDLPRSGDCYHSRRDLHVGNWGEPGRKIAMIIVSEEQNAGVDDAGHTNRLF